MTKDQAIIWLKEHALASKQQTCFALSSLEFDKELIISALGISEQGQLKKYKFPKRHNEWLAGRIVAKRCTKNYLLNYYSIETSLEDINIQNREDGRPTLQISGYSGHMPDISISHSNELAIAIVSENKCGIDIQKAVPTLLKVKERFCSKKEGDLLIANKSNELKVLSQLWSAKEAIQKFVSKDGKMPGFLELLLEEVSTNEMGTDLFHFSQQDTSSKFEVNSTTFDNYGLSYITHTEQG
ncbi:MAG: 4'-phosphopantetheinyl transferase superfamily protein [Desulfotalea sp.]